MKPVLNQTPDISSVKKMTRSISASTIPTLDSTVHSDDSTCSFTPSEDEQAFYGRNEAAQDITSSCSHSPCAPLGPSSPESPASPVEATATATSTSSSGKKRVRFGSLVIHEHAVQLGGSGVPGSGPSISLGWREENCYTVDSLEEYEDSRPCLPRKSIEMLQPKSQRVDLLLNAGYSMNQIRVCSNECDEIRKLRSRTVSRVQFGYRTKSNLKKLLTWKKEQPKNE